MRKTTTNLPAKTTTTARVTVRLSESRYGNMQPQMDLSGATAHDAPYRLVNATCLRIAAAVEDATAAAGREGWIVQLGDERSYVYLELADGTPAEAARGMAVLETVARAINAR